jgi:hypothetical protein
MQSLQELPSCTQETSEAGRAVKQLVFSSSFADEWKAAELVISAQEKHRVEIRPAGYFGPAKGPWEYGCLTSLDEPIGFTRAVFRLLWPRCGGSLVSLVEYRARIAVEAKKA